MGLLSDFNKNTKPTTPLDAMKVRTSLLQSAGNNKPMATRNPAAPTDPAIRQSLVAAKRAEYANAAKPVVAPPIAAAAPVVDDAAAAASRLAASGIGTGSVDDMLKALSASMATPPTAAAAAAAAAPPPPTTSTLLDDALKQAEATIKAHEAAGNLKPTASGASTPVSGGGFNPNDKATIKQHNARLKNMEGYRNTNRAAAKSYAQQLSDLEARRTLKPVVNDTTKAVADAAKTAAATSSTTGAVADAAKTAAATSSTTGALGTAGKLLGAGARIAGTADTAFTTLGDVTQEKFRDQVGNNYDINSPIGKALMGAGVSISDMPEEVMGRLSRGLGYGAGAVSQLENPFPAMWEGLTDDYTTTAEQTRADAGSVNYSPIGALVNLAMGNPLPSEITGLPSQAGKVLDAAVTPQGVQSVKKDTPQRNTIGSQQGVPSGGLDPNQTLRLGNSVYDLRNFTNVGNNIYRDNANPNAFVGVGTRDPNPKPAYSLETLDQMKKILNYDTSPVRDTTNSDIVDANREYRQKVSTLQQAFDEGRIGPRQLSSGTAEFARIRDQRIATSSATNAAEKAVKQAQNAENRVAVDKASGKTDGESKPLSQKDLLSLVMDTQKFDAQRDDEKYKRSEAANKSIMDALDNAAGGTDTPLSREYRRLYQQLPPQIREAALNDGAAARDAIPQIVGALERTVRAQNESADNTGATLLGGAGGALIGANAAKLTGGLGAALDALIGIKAKGVGKAKPFTRLLNNRLAGAAAGGGIGAGVGASIGPSPSQIPELPVYGNIDANDPTRMGLQHGSPNFADVLANPGGAYRMFRGDANTYRTPGGYLTQISPDDARTLALLQSIYAQNKPTN